TSLPHFWLRLSSSLLGSAGRVLRGGGGANRAEAGQAKKAAPGGGGKRDNRPPGKNGPLHARPGPEHPRPAGWMFERNTFPWRGARLFPGGGHSFPPPRRKARHGRG